MARWIHRVDRGRRCGVPGRLLAVIAMACDRNPTTGTIANAQAGRVERIEVYDTPSCHFLKSP